MFIITSSQNVILINEVKPSCSGGCDGSLTFSVSGFSPPFSVLVSNTTCPISNIINFSTNTITINNLCKCDSNYTFSFYAGTTNISNEVIYTYPIILIGFAANSAISCMNTCDATATVFISNGAPPYTYTWAPAGVYTATFSNACPTSYTVTFTDINGCKGSTQLLIINPPNECVGIKEFELSERIDIYPNPVSTNVYLSKECSISVYNLFGGAVREEVKAKNIYLGDLPAGTYYLRIGTDTGENQYRKIFKE